jgi:hypothetical protein
LKVELGHGARTPDMRRFCQANLDIDVPNGLQVGVKKLGFNGNAALAKGTKGRVMSTVYSSGETNDV